ncbi:hypothetical protein Syun_027662 [Stephania yunnanensis]|uniref:Uncharacterized protein n=1 Tax=Stephania yunnanensis TaxID=152371 RepID=A0AAP0EFZ2_9MAGN
MLLQILVMGKIVECGPMFRNKVIKLISKALDVPEREAAEQLNKDLKVNKAWLKRKWRHKPSH